MKKIPYVEIYTDGSYIQNLNSGAYCAYLVYQTYEKIIYGCIFDTTNNRMELTAPLEALKILKIKCKVDIYSDSQYFVNGINIWIDNWVLKNWKSNSGKVLNRDIWEELWQMKQYHQIKAHWIKGHSNHPQNELVDDIAFTVAKNINKYNF